MKVIAERNLQLATVVICALLVALAFLIVIPIAVLQVSLDGQCLLYADSRDYGPKSACGYSIAVATLFQFLYGIARAALTLLILLGVLTKEVMSLKRFTIPCTIADVIACLLTLVSGGVISHGFSVMCSKIFFPQSDRCGTVGIYMAAPDSFLENYYQCLNVAEIGVWPSWVLWILLVVVDVLTVHKAGLLQNLPFSLPSFTLPCFGETSRNASPAANRSEPVAVTSSSGNTGKVASARAQFTALDAGGGSKTPPPRRPVPPRPADVPAVTKPLMKPEEHSDEELDAGERKIVRPIYRRTVSPT